MVKGKVAYLYDSASEFFNEDPTQDLYLVSNHILYTENGVHKCLAENVDIDHNKVMELMQQKVDLKTSLVNPEQVRKKVLELLKTYDYVYYVPISSSISSGYDKVVPIQKEINKQFNREAFVVVKSNAVSFLSEIVMNRVKDLFTGSNNEEVQNIITDEVNRNLYCGILFVNDLNCLIKGGRIKRVKGAIAKIFNFKLLVLMGKSLEFLDKAVSYNTQIQKMLDFFNDLSRRENKPIEAVYITYDGLQSTMQKYQKDLQLIPTMQKNLNLVPDAKFYEGLLPGCIMVHTGLNSVGVMIKLKNN